MIQARMDVTPDRTAGGGRPRRSTNGHTHSRGQEGT
jgi:hypothetical protein